MNKFLVLSLLVCGVVTAEAGKPNTEVSVLRCNNPAIEKKYALTDILDWDRIAKEFKDKTGMKKEEFRLILEYYGTISRNCPILVCDFPVSVNPQHTGAKVYLLRCDDDVIEKQYNLANIINWDKIAKEFKDKTNEVGFRLNFPHSGMVSYLCPTTK